MKGGFGMSIFFSGKIVLVTGGTSGIGRAVVMELARKGATVIICGRDGKTGDIVNREIGDLNGILEFIQADISDSKQVDRLFSRIRNKYKRLDCALNAAGAEAEIAPLAFQTEKHFDEMVSVDLKGTWLCMKSEIQIMQDQGKGAIVNCSAMAGLRGSQGSSIYSACKHGIIGLTKSAALECVDSNIRINSVCPGIIQTPGLDRTFGKVPGFSFEEVKNWGISQIPMKRFGRPEEAAKAVLWLFSNESSYLTGHSLIIDGGIHCK
jgi:NAD(P)-dependent dehydrogenase (short-subunit alcohol dehydrogenase family)